MLGIPEPTPYDLRFRIIGIPVRVHPLFWLVSALLSGGGNDIGLVLTWIGCVFVSILVHELGHALMGRMFRRSPTIILYSMGGLCVSEPERRPWQRLAVLFCGPGAGFVLLGLIEGIYFAAGQPPLSDQGRRILYDMEWINLWWGLVNLLPLWPLDGGQMTGVIFTMFNKRNGMRWAHVVSLVTAGVLALCVWRFYNQDLFLMIFFATFAFINYQILHQMHQAERSGAYDSGDNADWWKR